MGKSEQRNEIDLIICRDLSIIQDVEVVSTTNSSGYEMERAKVILNLEGAII